MQNQTSVDPLGHIKFSVSNIKKSKVFYNKLLGQLGYKNVGNYPDATGWAGPNGFGVWIEEAELKEPAYKFSAPGIHHFCFKAKSQQEVDKLYRFLLKENIHIFDPPETYPQYTPDYYAVFFADPDDIKLELAYY
jgi:glyoxylase I family protein